MSNVRILEVSRVAKEAFPLIKSAEDLARFCMGVYREARQHERDDATKASACDFINVGIPQADGCVFLILESSKGRVSIPLQGIAAEAAIELKANIEARQQMLEAGPNHIGEPTEMVEPA